MKVTIALSTTAMNCAEDNNPSAAHRLVELTPRIVDRAALGLADRSRI